MGGSLLSLLFTAFAASIKLNKENITLKNMANAFGEGIDAMMHVGRASLGDRTMLDALIPAHEALTNSSCEEALLNAALAAKKGAELTKTLKAKAGRASYCKDRNTSEAADAGAVMVAHVFAAMNNK